MVMIEEDNKIWKCNQDKKILKSPFIIYANTESLLDKIHTSNNYPEKSSTTKISKQTVCCYSLFTHCSFDSSKSIFYRGVDCMKKFSADLKNMQLIIKFEKKKVLPLTDEEIGSYINQKFCHICKKKVHDADDNDDDIADDSGDDNDIEELSVRMFNDDAARLDDDADCYDHYDSNHEEFDIRKLPDDTTGGLDNNEFDPRRFHDDAAEPDIDYDEKFNSIKFYGVNKNCERVHNHCHYIGKNREATHSICILRYKTPK